MIESLAESLCVGFVKQDDVAAARGSSLNSAVGEGLQKILESQNASSDSHSLQAADLLFDPFEVGLKK